MNHSTVRTPHGGSRRMVAMTVAAVVAALGMVAVSAGTAQAAARLTATSSLGGAVASTSGPTTFTVSGSGFQAVQGGFGGVYVGFGWVDGSNWGPSKGGATGTSYDYVPDEQSRSNKGYQAFVAFPGSETSGEAQGTMGADGSFRISLTVPGPTFTGAGGKRIDCRQVTCGFLTWGAHGVRNGANESFTPVTFQGGATPAASAEAAAPAQASPDQATAGRAATARSGQSGGRAAGRAEAVTVEAPSGGAASGGAVAEDQAAENAPAAPAPVATGGGTTVSAAGVIEVDRKSARPGGAMGFAAAGFWPAEQVYVVLGDGLAAVGPVLAGTDGEVAGVIVLPEDLEAGTHEIRAAGAGSAIEAVERFPVRVDMAPAATSSGLGSSMKWVFVALSTLVLLAAAAAFIRRRQRTAGPGEQDGGDGPADGGTPGPDSGEPCAYAQADDAHQQMDQFTSYYGESK